MKINGLKQTLIIIIGLVIAVLSIVWVFIIIESYSYRSEIIRISDEIKSATDRDSYLSSIRNVLRGTEGDVSAIESRFIGEDDVPGFIEFLERRARDIGIKAELTGINLDPVVKNSIFRVLHVRINASGSWQEAISLINALDMMPYAMNIDHVSLSKAPNISTDSKVLPNSVWNIVIDISQYTR